MFILKACFLGTLREPNNPNPFDSQYIDGSCDEHSENKFIILSDYNLAWSRSKAVCERNGLEMFDERNGLEKFAMQLWQTMIYL